MPFQLIPILDQINDLYKLPLGKERFDKYLALLQGDSTDEMKLPIPFFNPMAKELAIEKLDQLIQLRAEEIAIKEIQIINETLELKDNRSIQVGINLIDDLEGAWSNYAITAFKSKFDLSHLVNRNFCTPCFWTSEKLNKDLIINRIKEYIFRTIYCLKKGDMTSLSDFLEQEIYVKLEEPQTTIPSIKSFDFIEKFYEKHSESTDYNLNFSFFYGDEASKQLGFPTYGFSKNEGFDYASFLAEQRK